MKARTFGLLIATIGMLGVTPDALLLRYQEEAGGQSSVILIWRFILVGILNLVVAVFTQGGFRELWMSSSKVPLQMLIGSLIVAVTNIGFVFSLLKVDPAKALLLISLNPIWAALLGKVLLKDVLPTRTIVAQVLSLISIIIVIVPTVQSLLGLSDEDERAKTSGGPDELLDFIPLVTGMAMALFLTLSRSVSFSKPDGSLDAAPALGAFITSGVAVHLAREDGIVSPFAGIKPAFWLFLLINGAGVAAYNVALVLAPRYLTGAEVALVLLGETVIGPIWVFFGFGDVPAVWTLIGGALLLCTLVGHEVAGLLQNEMPDEPHPSMSIDSSRSSSSLHNISRASYYSPVQSPTTGRLEPLLESGQRGVPQRVNVDTRMK